MEINEEEFNKWILSVLDEKDKFPKTKYTVLKMEESFNQYAIITSKIGIMVIRDAFRKYLENEKMNTNEREKLEKLVSDITLNIRKRT